MAYTISDGPAGLEGIHTWNSALALNDRDGGLPYIRLSEITGLYGLPDADDQRDPRTGRQGETPRPGFSRGKTAVYTGLLVASGPQALRAYTSEVRAAFAERAYEHLMRIAPPAFASGGPIWAYGAKVLGLDIPERQDVGITAVPSPWQRTATLTLRLSDGRFVVDEAPLDAGPFADGSTHAITVAGTADTEPTFTGTVTAGADVLLENASVPIASGGHAFLRFLAVPASGAITIDFAARSALLVSGPDTIDLMGYFDSTSNWWDEQVPGLIAGANSLTVTGAASWHVLHTPKSW